MIQRLLVCTTLLACVVGCGSGAICFGGNCSDDDDDEKTVIVSGNIDSVVPPNAVRQLVAFVYTRLEDVDLADGAPFDDFKDAKAVLVDEEGAFRLEKISRGPLTVIILRDDPEADGSIDPGDECAVLLGSDLDDVAGGRSVEIQDLDVDFRASGCSGPQPAAGCGCARADDIIIRIVPPSAQAGDE